MTGIAVTWEKIDGSARLMRASTAKPKWRNWQTRQLQELVPAREWRFESSLRHYAAQGLASKRHESFFMTRQDFANTMALAWDSRWTTRQVCPWSAFAASPHCDFFGQIS